MATAINAWANPSTLPVWPLPSDADFDSLEGFDNFEDASSDSDFVADTGSNIGLVAKQAGSEYRQLPVSVGLDGTSKYHLRDQVVLDHLPLAKAIAIRVHENLPVHVELDDLVHAGVLGLFSAARKYDPEKKVAFSSYAKHRIRGSILDSLRQLDWASRDLRRRHKQFEAVTRELAGELHRNPTEAEIAERLGVDVDRCRQMMLDMRSVGLLSASTRSSEHDELPAPDFPSGPETQPDHMCAREQMRYSLGEALKTLPDRYKQVVTLYYTNEFTMKEIGTKLGINESRVSQIHKLALEKMNAALQTAGISSASAF
jgi:RNA polymerase sigma factor for flagellar operon FliA